jgi:molybdate-binding protein/DNA-binding transcriptional ArsR family regulator
LCIIPGVVKKKLKETEVRRLRSFPRIKILSDARRLAVIRLLMREPATLSQLGDQLGMSAARVRHHLKILEGEGMVALVRTRPVGGFTEKYYRATAQAYFIQRAILPDPGREGTLFIIGSDDPALALLAQAMKRGRASPVLKAIPVGSLEGLMALRQGFCQVAGCHLYEPLEGTYNTSYVHHLFPGQPMELITLAHREQGLLVAPGNPLGLSGIPDLVARPVRFVNRPPGSGTRLWLDQKLADLGLEANGIEGYRREVSTHAQVAEAVRTGEADVGLAVLAVAQTHELDFIPLFEERFDLVLARPALQDPLVIPLLEALNAGPTRERIAGLAGYRTSQTGTRVDLD